MITIINITIQIIMTSAMRSAVTRPGSREPSITPNWMP